jgi:hypothetical protein
MKNGYFTKPRFWESEKVLELTVKAIPPVFDFQLGYYQILYLLETSQGKNLLVLFAANIVIPKIVPFV